MRDERTVHELLYQCIRELQSVQDAENCESGLCATAKGKELIEAGMKNLGVKGLRGETLFEQYSADGKWL